MKKTASLRGDIFSPLKGQVVVRPAPESSAQIPPLFMCRHMSVLTPPTSTSLPPLPPGTIQNRWMLKFLGVELQLLPLSKSFPSSQFGRSGNW